MNLQVNAKITAAITTPNAQISTVTAPLNMTHRTKYSKYMSFPPSFFFRLLNHPETQKALFRFS